MARRKAATNTLTEVAPLREVPRAPECCDRPMRKLQSVSAATGSLITVWSCGSCGAQRRDPVA